MMTLSLAAHAPLDSRVDLLLVATCPSVMQQDIAPYDRALQGVLSQEIARVDFNAADGAALLMHTHGVVAPRLLVLVGVDPAAGPRTWHQLADTSVRLAREVKAASLALAFGRDLGTAEAITATAEGIVLAAYTFDRFKSKPVLAGPNRIELLVDRADTVLRTAHQRGQLFAAATCYARDLIMMPAAVVTPTYLANEAKRLARRHHLRVRVHDRRSLSRLGMGAILGVAQGSTQQPRLIEITYVPRQRAKKRLAIVGKGITFDSGGLSLKHADSMQGQKRDMAGGAVVLAVMSAVGTIAPAIEVRGYVAAAENMPDGGALKPGDVVRAYNGKTIEVLNTDAEGRLVLADALSYAAKSKPDVIIDLATLTAAVGTALGRRYAALMTTDAALTQDLIAAGRRAGENLWELPLAEEYRPDINSRVADIKNIGESYAGTIIGGLFLREFVGSIPWAHIDFSSTVVTDKPFPAHPPGATGFGVRTLLQYVITV
jgi:leucyl aminopeptidase